LGRRSLFLTWLFCIQIALILGVGSRQRQNKDLQVLLLNIFVLQRSAGGCDSEDLKDKNKSFLQTIFFICPSSFSICLCRFFLFYCGSTRKKQQQSLQREKATWREKVVHILRDRNNLLSFIACGRRQQTAVETKLMVSTFKLER
jgi:hypothetical protein